MERDMITAEWARNKTNEVLGKKSMEQVNKCLDEIEIGANDGETSLDISFTPEEMTLKELKSRGFKVEVFPAHSQREPTYITIKW